jgi:hypothetical protein
MSDDATTLHHDERARASTEENQRHAARRSGRAIDCGASTKPQDDEVISWRQQAEPCSVRTVLAAGRRLLRGAAAVDLRAIARRVLALR